MDPNNNQNSQQGGGTAQGLLRQTVNRGFSFGKKYLLVSSTVICVILITVFIVFFFGNVSGVAGGQPPSQPAPPIGQQSTYTFVALGDSLTAWPCDPVTFGCVDSNPWGSYRFTGNPWPTHLTTDNPNLKLLHNAGYPAQTTAYMLTQEPGVLSTHKPDVLFVLGGTNDILNGGISEQQTIANLKSIISTAQSSTYGVKKVIVLTIPNQCNGYNTSLNTAIKELSTLAPVIDISKTSSLTLDCASDVQTSDHLHLTDAGAKKVADYIDAQIKAQNLLPTRSAPTFHFYCQYDRTYTIPACNITHDGCGPTSMAMVLTSFGDTYTPLQVAQTNNIGCVDPGTTFDQEASVINHWIKSMGYAVQKLGVSASDNISVDTVRTLTTNGYYILAGACMKYNIGNTGSGGHSIVITGVNTDNTFKVADPTYCRSDTNYQVRSLNPTYPGPDIIGGCPGLDPGASWGGWGYAYALKKQ